MRGDAIVSEHRERPVEPSARRRSATVLIDDVAALRLADRGDDRHLEIARALSPLDLFDQLPPGNGFVGDDQEMHRLPTFLAAAEISFRKGERCSAVTRARSAHQ